MMLSIKVAYTFSKFGSHYNVWVTTREYRLKYNHISEIFFYLPHKIFIF